MSHRFAVVGNPVSHSLSPVIHQEFARQANLQLIYEKIKCDDQAFTQQVTDFFAAHGKGLNITVPFKQKAFDLAQVTTARCQLAGAANTLWMQDQVLHADNTDGIGFVRDIYRYLDLQGKNILILGAGGAARGIIPAILGVKPAQLLVANRTQTKAAELQALFPALQIATLDDLIKLTNTFDLIINATSASLDNQVPALSPNLVTTQTLCYDLAYKQNDDTVFVAYAKSLGCKGIGGLGMLVEQAAEAFYIWHGVRPSTQQVLDQLRK